MEAPAKPYVEPRFALRADDGPAVTDPIAAAQCNLQCPRGPDLWRSAETNHQRPAARRIRVFAWRVRNVVNPRWLRDGCRRSLRQPRHSLASATSAADMRWRTSGSG